MPALPTLNLSQAHFDRVVAAFPGANLTQKAQAYNNWLVNNLIAFVEDSEMRVINAQAAAARDAKVAELEVSLPPRLPFPPF
jgi:hypothetical protein